MPQEYPGLICISDPMMETNENVNDFWILKYKSSVNKRIEVGKPVQVEVIGFVKRIPWKVIAPKIMFALI